MAWNLSGTYFEACNCEAVCPCIFLSPPTEGECTALVGWHIESGEFEGLSLEGLNVALAVYSAGHMATTKWQVALYLDDQASEQQSEALGAIFSGASGGHPSLLAGHIGEVVGVASAPISFDADASTLSFKVGDVADTTIKAIEGQGGGQVTVAGHPLAIAPGNEAVAARSETFRLSDHSFDWEFSERAGLVSPFQYAN